MVAGRTVALALVALVVPAGVQARPYELKARGSAKSLGAGGSACKPDLGRAQVARVLRDERWHTARGLHVGDRLRRLKRLYPSVRRHGRAYWLVTGRNVFGPRPSRYAVLAATVQSGRVSSFTLSIGAAGE